MKPFSFVLVCLFAFCLTAPLSAQDDAKVPQKQSKRKAGAIDKGNKGKTESVPQITDERKVELLAFVDANHPELKELLSKLEKRKKKQRPYLQAMAGLDKAVKKLEGIKERAPRRYDSALKQWNLESRIKVAAAQVKLNDSEESRSNLESLVTQLVDFHIARMKNDREQLLKRLQSFEKRIADAESNREKVIEKRIKSVTRKKGKKEKKKE